ncbi:hypothetical protein QTP70_029644 [Hemibagrus guttatus]|uniref:Phostensin n=1 Tax=Hemibagrus guttatus TaxID=175788 RepID=A0AAE0QP35_9TELE|nr:hypothetical protein QTP70_029644 [Hemibagrus guttatus]
MSVSMLPEWKQLLLERKRREEEEREKGERQEEERLASMPAWKRGIIQRRRAKQEGGEEKEREKAREAGRELETETVFVEPVWKNYFLCSQNGFTREQRKESEVGNNEGKTQREGNYEWISGEEKEKYNEKEDKRGKWRDREIQIEKTRDREINKGMKERESDAERGKNVGERDEDCFHLISGIRTIKAENIIIIAKRNNRLEKVERYGQRETEEGKKQGMRLDLKEILPGGENVTEICVSDVLIIKPSIKEERSKKDRKQGNENEKKTTLGKGEETEFRRVRQLISKFGENCKFPCRSKSSDCFIPMEMGGEVKKEERKKGDRKEECRTEGSANVFRGIPKRSYSFSEKVSKERRVLERSHSDQRRKEIKGEMEKEEKRKEERKESGHEDVNETDDISTFKGEMKRFREQNNQKTVIKKDKISGETEKEMEEIQKERNDREQQRKPPNESQKIVRSGQEVTPVPQSMVKFSDEKESQINREERGMTWNEAEHHRGEIFTPRSVFYGISEQSFSKRDRDEIRQVERTLSWKAGRPLTRVESLKQRLWQKERGGTEGGDERARKAEMESRQEVASPQSVSQFDVTREVSKEELPVCVPPSFSAERGPSVFIDRHDKLIQTPEKETERDVDLLGEDYIPPSQSSSSSSSPSPPLGHSQPAMSRIYNNLKPVSSRTGVCVTERNLGVQTHSGGMIKIRTGGQFAAGPLKIQTESSLQSVQREVEQLHLKEQEAQKKNDGDASQKQNLHDTCQHQNVDIQKSQPHTILKPSSEPKVQTQLPQLSTSMTKSINTQTEPTVTTSATPLFTIRSASGGAGKRGATFTITPRKSGSSATPSSSVTAPKVSSTSSTTSKAPSNTAELSKKRYPTAEEIEVIGGYQKLERSCLLKNRGSPKMGRVSFDDSGVRVCTYPPEEVSVVGEEETSDSWRRPEEKQEENDEECSMDEIIGAGRGMNRVLRVDESCKR